MSESQARVDFTIVILAIVAFIVFVVKHSMESEESSADILQLVPRINLTAPHCACDDNWSGHSSVSGWLNLSPDQIREGAY